MIWLKRLLPIVVILLGWFTWKGITSAQQEKATAIDNQYALVTAQVWLASATYREEKAKFLSYRDSLMQANNITSDDLFHHLAVFEQDLGRELLFSQLVSRKIDSLLKATPTISAPPSVTDSSTAKPTVQPTEVDSAVSSRKIPLPMADSSK